MPFISNTAQQRSEMLSQIGLADMEDLFADIPPELRCKDLDIPAGLTEQETRQRLSEIASRNEVHVKSFLGGGFYDHFVPAAVPAIVMRSEFYTAYTPYQPEMSQGTLQAIYEYQSAICRLTGMEAANASMYDGGTALYEAMMMAVRITRRNRVIIDDSVSGIYRTIIRSYTTNLGIELVEVSSADGVASREAIREHLNDQTAAVLVQNPTFFGCIDDVSDIAEAAHASGALLIVSTYPIALGLLKPPGEMGADIVTGEGQCLGMPVSFGGPYLGFMATRMKYIRKMPGRIAGKAFDDQGRPGYVLTLQAREQHIRREKAMSNICTNEGLCALTSLVYLSLLGKGGLCDLAQLCADRAAYAMDKLTAIDGVELRFPNRSHFNEFVLDLPVSADRVIERLVEHDIAAGFPLGRYWSHMENSLLVAVTEKRTKADIDLLAATLEGAI